MNELTDEIILILLAQGRLLEAKLERSKDEVTHLQYKCATYKRRIAKQKAELIKCRSSSKVTNKSYKREEETVVPSRPGKAKDSQGGYFVPGPFSVSPALEPCKNIKSVDTHIKVKNIYAKSSDGKLHADIVLVTWLSQDGNTIKIEEDH